MIAFWVVAGVLSALGAGLILWSSARAAGAAGADDPTTALYRRQLREIDDLAERGLIPEAERATTRAEAGRRLLAAEGAAVGWEADVASRRPVLVVAALTPLLALGLYFMVGSPAFRDQPFAARVAQWRAADPASLAAPEMAVVLRALIRERGDDPDAFGYLAQAEMASDNPAEAVRAMRRAVELAPARADLWEGLGEAFVVQAQGQVTDQAQAAFEEALKRDPKSVNARFHLARARIETGDREGGLAAWRALAEELPAIDPRRTAVREAIASAEGRRAPAFDEAQTAAVQGMVASLAARLEAEPDDPEGWVRLVRSYAVLGEAAKRDAALASARARYAGRPEVLQALDGAAKTEVTR